MKKSISLLLALLLLLHSLSAFAEEDYITEPYTVTEDGCIDVLLTFELTDESLLEVPLRIKAFTITYQYWLFRDVQTGIYTGFVYDPRTVVTLTPLAIDDEDEPNFTQFLLDCIDLKLTHLSSPDQSHYTKISDEAHKVEFVGGEYEISYKTNLHFSSYDGSLLDADEATETREYTHTFSNEDG